MLRPRENARLRRLGIAFVLFGLSLSTMSFLARMPLFSGLGLASFLIGLLLTYVPAERSVSSQLVSALCQSSLVNLNSLLEELGVTSKAIYIPSKERQPHAFLPLLANPEPSSISLRGLKANKLLVAEGSDPDRSGLLLVPPGASLATLIEEETGIDFSSVNLPRLEDALRSGLVEGLEIAEAVRVTFAGESLSVELGPLISEEFCQSQSGTAPVLCGQVGCPLCSAVICAATKAADRPLQITRISPLPRGRVSIELKQLEADQR